MRKMKKEINKTDSIDSIFIGGLRLPKASMFIEDLETGEIIAEDGRWKKLPADNTKVVIKYKTHHKNHE